MKPSVRLGALGALRWGSKFAGAYRVIASSTSSRAIYQCVEYKSRQVGVLPRRQRLRGGCCIGPAAAAVVSLLGVVMVVEAYWVGWVIGRTPE